MEKITDQFLKIIDEGNDKDVISFLRSLSPENRKQLIPTIKKLSKEGNQLKEGKENTWSYSGSPEYRH